MKRPNSMEAQAFPPHDVDPREKEQKKYGLQCAKAIWFHNDAYAPSLFYNDRELYTTYIKYAFGEQDTEQYKPTLGVNPANKDQSFLGGIRWANKNFATKRVNTTVSKVYNKHYDPVARAVDPISIDRKESFQASVKAWMEQQAWLAERQSMLGVNMMPEGMDMSSLPLNDEELEHFMKNDYKLNTEIDIELGVMHHLSSNDFPTIKQQLDFYLTVLPVAACWVGMTPDGFPMVKTLNPSRILSPRSEFGNFKRLQYCAYVDDYTVAEFKRLAGNYFDKDKLNQLIREFSNKGNYYTTRRYHEDYPYTDRDVDKIQVMHFEFATTNELVYLDRVDKYGNQRFVRKPFDYYRTSSEQEKFRNKYRDTRSIKRIQYPTVYSGYWVVGSDEVFAWTETNYCNGELGYKLRATNMHEGYSTCLLKQMIPSLDLLETYDKKIQQIVAAAIPKGVFIDLFALRKASFKMNGRDMGPAELIEMFFQRGILVGDTGDNYANSSGSTYKPIVEIENGMSSDIVQYLALMKHELEVLDEITGYNRVSAGSTLSPETGARVAQQMDIATETALDHIFRADRELCKDVYSSLACLHFQSVQMNPDYYIPIFGETAVNRILQVGNFIQYGIDVEARPTQQEWNEFYMDIDGLSKTGMLMPEDKAALRRCNSLKQAYSLLKVLTNRRKKEAAEQQLAAIQENANTQAMSNQQAHESNVALKDKDIEKELMKIDKQLMADRYRHQWKMEEIERMEKLQNKGKFDVEEMRGETQLEVAKMNKNKRKE